MEIMSVIKNKKVTVYESLKKRIIEGHLPPGLPIIEADLAGELGVSKTPIREALRQLESDGFVDNIPGRGSMVSYITSQDIRDIFEIREIIECGAARRAALLPAPDKEELKGKRKELEQAHDHGGGSSEDIYLSVFRVLGNRCLLEMYLGVLDRIKWIRNHFGRSFTQRRFNEIVAEHMEILDAIIAGDAERSEQLVEKHLHKAGSYIMGLAAGRRE